MTLDADSQVETEAATALAQCFEEQVGTDYEGGKQIIMKALGGIPLSRPTKPQEVADLIAFFASPRAGAIAGTEFVIDGGTVPTILQGRHPLETTHVVALDNHHSPLIEP